MYALIEKIDDTVPTFPVQMGVALQIVVVGFSFAEEFRVEARRAYITPRHVC